MRPAMVEKQKIIDEIKNNITNAKATFVVQFQGLDVKDISSLRKELKTQGAQIKIYKNNLVSRALQDSSFEGLQNDLIGPNAFVFGYENDLNTVKVLANFAKANNLLKLKAGIFENKIINSQELKTIASLPPKETLLSMLLFCLQSPVQRLAASIKAVAEKKEQE